MSSENLFECLSHLPIDHFDRLQDILQFDDMIDDDDSISSLGSCCSSPAQTSDSSLSPGSSQSPVEDPESGYFIFPTSYIDIPARVKTSVTGHRKVKVEGEKAKRKTECKIKRNERERRRVRRLADGFKKLRTVVPGECKKLSKLDTLKYAMSYINGLSTLLEAHDVQVMQEVLTMNIPQIIDQPVNIFFISSITSCVCIGISII